MLSSFKVTHRLKRYFKQIITKKKKKGIETLISDKIDFKNSKKRQIILLHNDKGSIHQEYTPIINIYAPIIAASKYIKQHLRRLKSKAIIIGDFDQFSSAQSFSGVLLFATPWTAALQASLSITISWSLLKLMSIESVMPSNHLVLCHPLLLLPSIFPSIRVFSHESVLSIRWSKYWSFSFSISPSNEYLGLISFRMDWLDLLAVQGTFKSLH